MYIYSNTGANLLFVRSEKPIKSFEITDSQGNTVDCRVLQAEENNGQWVTTLDARNLTPWSVENPALYTMRADGETVRFGHMSIRTLQNKMVLLNDAPIYLRGFIRGIRAHEHPNMTGLSDYEAAKKNILQAKKYGFNLVRFHSTIPSEDFVRAADELGFLVHMEIGFAYDYDEQGKKKNLAMNNENWEKVITKYRNCPSVAIFCIGNEMHNSGHYPQVRKLYELGKELAPNKLIMDNSGWGEYDRNTADIFCQHIAYFFPYAHHKDMFNVDAPWKINGSTYDVAMTGSSCTDDICADVIREATPIRPTLSHEAMHYIDIPDYEALNAKYDAFAAKVGPEYLEKHGIEKPRYLTALPALIAQKGLQAYMPDYQRASRSWKLMATKVFMEQLRLSPLCGYEMLQLADCLKYENKNGIIDFFDDDKGIDSNWMRQMNDDLVLLADMDKPYCYQGETLQIGIYASDFLPKAEIMGTLTVKLGEDTLYTGEKFVLGGGLQKLITLNIQAKTLGEKKLTAQFVSDGITVTNDWKLWFYPKTVCETGAELSLQDGALKDYLAGGKKESDLYISDTLNETLLEKLDAGKTAILLYRHGAEENTWQFQGALERFKPCIWDRGSNLGGIIRNKTVASAVGGELFDLNMQPLLEAGYKVNLDDCTFPVTEHILGVDKPVRDRMKGLIDGVKDFLPEDTLRKFSHLFSLQVGNGKLIVCTFNLSHPENPVVNNFLKVLLDNTDALAPKHSLALDAFRSWLENINEAGIRKEDVMNHFWEIDNKPVEDTLFWEEAKVDLSKQKSKKKKDE